jgi:type VI secretion system protein ImpJ
MSIAERLIEILDEKSAMLGRGASGHAATRTGLTPGEIASFWFQHALNSTAGPLRHLFYSTRTHPEQLYLALARLAGSLCTFAVEADPRLIPQYEHDNLTGCFDALDTFIRRHLDLVLPTNCVTVPLAPAGDYCFGGSVSDTRCFGRSQWILSIRSSAGEAHVIAKTPHVVKVCSMEFIRRLVQRAMPGLTLTHLPAPPSAISPRVEYEYFLIGKSGPCWDHITQTHAVGIYVPNEMPDAEIELSVLLETGTS